MIPRLLERLLRGLVSVILAGWLVLTGPAWPSSSSAAEHPPEQVPTTQVVYVRGSRFEPRHLTVREGDTVRFALEAGGPHNVVFWPDSVPTGGEAFLARAMPDTIAHLMGVLLLEGESYTVAFTEAPPGVYKYYCLPHLAGGMRGEVEVERR